ncbi:hypothetical protein [Streptomyces hyaluromycini]|uniref:hypothetical protein n=1 Tax=Streptomyces hyaluromycini TaxID=1377993 RepID=UPI001237F671|nr:hypothetical protein [Streptomyces hyaluromycini]
MWNVTETVGALAGPQPDRLRGARFQVDLAFAYVDDCHFQVTPDGDVVRECVVPYFGAFGAGVGMKSSRGAQNADFRAYR